MRPCDGEYMMWLFVYRYLLMKWNVLTIRLYVSAKLGFRKTLFL